MKPFCANEKCFMNAMEVADDVFQRDVQWPDGSVKSCTRGWLVVRENGHRYPLCSACGTVIEIVERNAENLKPSLGVPASLKPGPEIKPFCANELCFTHILEVPAWHSEVEVGLPDGNVRRFRRDWILSMKEQRRFPLCDTCGNVLAVIRGDGEGLAPDTGMELAGQFIDPEGRVIASNDPEPGPADITEPEIIH